MIKDFLILFEHLLCIRHEANSTTDTTSFNLTAEAMNSYYNYPQLLDDKMKARESCVP